MSQQSATTTESASSRAVRRNSPAAPLAATSTRTLSPVLVLVVGAILTGVCAGTILGVNRIGSRVTTAAAVGPTLAKLAPGDIASAIVTLDPDVSKQAAADAKSCKAPLAWVTVAKQPGEPDGSIRIRSGSYLSPAFHVTAEPQRVAIPFPAPYQTGHGVLWVIGQGKGLAIDLDPSRNIQSLDGAVPISVVWDPSDPC